MTIGIILAGGKSRRFKQDKALYVDPKFQKTWLEIAVIKMQAVTTELYLSVNPENQNQITALFPDLAGHILLDDPQFLGEGPLSGLYTIAKQHPTADFLLLAVDYPDISIASLKKISRQANVYAIDENEEPHFTVAHLSISPTELVDYLTRGQRRLGRFYQQIGLTPLSLPTKELVNYNYPLNE